MMGRAGSLFVLALLLVGCNVDCGCELSLDSLHCVDTESVTPFESDTESESSATDEPSDTELITQYSPFWKVSEMIGESALFIDNEDGHGARAKLLFTPTEVLSVVRPIDSKAMVENIDYTVDYTNGYLTAVEGGALESFKRTDMLVAKDAKNGDQFVRIETTGSGAAYIFQDVLEVGRDYRVQGKCAGNGGVAPVVTQAGVQNVWVGTAGQGWQYFDTTFTANIVSLIYVGTTPSSASGAYVRCNNLVLEDVENPGTNLLVDGDFEADDLVAWQFHGNPVVTKDRDSFTLKRASSSRYARIESSQAGDATIYQDILTPGAEYRFIGFCNGDGSTVPVVFLPNEQTLFECAASTVPQRFDVTFIPTTQTQVHFGLQGAVAAGSFVEFDLMRVETPDGENVLEDGDMELDGFYAWQSTNCPLLSKVALPATSAVDEKAWLFSNDEYVLRRYVEVSYKHSGTEWAERGGPVLSDPLNVPGVLHSGLNSGSSLKIAYMGDSIVKGSSSSGVIGLPPYGDFWVPLFQAYLEEEYEAEVLYQNFAVGGDGSAAGPSFIPAVSAYAPDVVFVGYGVNDAGSFTSAATYRANIDSLFSGLRSQLPDVEIVLLSPIVSNPQWQGFGGALSRYTDYLEQLKDVREVNTDVSVVDLTSLWIEMHNLDSDTGYMGKDYMSVQSNNANHPADWGHKVMAQAVIEALDL